MNLIYINDYVDLKSVNQWKALHNLDSSNCLQVESLDTLMDSLVIGSYDIVVFDYNCDSDLVEALRTFDMSIRSLKVFCKDIETGMLYTPLTEDIYIMSEPINIMVYAWEHLAFSLPNVIGAKRYNEKIFDTIVSPIEGENEGVLFDTQIEEKEDIDIIKITLKNMVVSEEVYEEEMQANEVIAIADDNSDKIENPAVVADTIYDTSDTHALSTDIIIESANQSEVINPEVAIESETEDITEVENTVEPEVIANDNPSNYGDDYNDNVLEDAIPIDETPAEISENTDEDKQSYVEDINGDKEDNSMVVNGYVVPDTLYIPDISTVDSIEEQIRNTNGVLEVEQIEEPVIEPIQEESVIEQVQEESIKSTLESNTVIEPVIESIQEEPIPESIVESNLEETTATIESVETIEIPETPETLESIEPLTESNTEIIESSETVEPMQEETVETVEPVQEETIETVAESITEPVVESITEPVVESITEPVQEESIVESSRPVEQKTVEVKPTKKPSFFGRLFNGFRKPAENEVVEYNKIVAEMSDNYDKNAEFTSSSDSKFEFHKSSELNSENLYNVTKEEQDKLDSLIETEKSVDVVEEVSKTIEVAAPVVTESNTKEVKILKGITPDANSTVASYKDSNIIERVIQEDYKDSPSKLSGKGRLGSLRKPKIINYSSPYEYFKTLYPGREGMDAMYDKYLEAKNNGANVLIENMFLNEHIINEEEYLLFCRDYLRQSILRYDELSVRDVILSEYDIKKCKELYFLELVSLNEFRTFCVAIDASTKTNTTQMLKRQHDNINIVYTMKSYIKERLSMND